MEAYAECGNTVQLVFNLGTRATRPIRCTPKEVQSMEIQFNWSLTLAPELHVPFAVLAREYTPAYVG